ncbi:MAG: cytidine deaminase [Bacillota bacterium]
MEDREVAELIEAARAARGKAYVPYSNFAVGAAVRTVTGEVYTGCNIENGSYGLTNCAERTAIFKAVSEGHRRFTHLAVICDTRDVCTPCGACRQVISEFGEGMTIYLTNLQGKLRVVRVDDLLPGAFNLTENRR